MAKYLVVETRDPFDSNDVDDIYELATGLADDDSNDVTVFLVQNGVLPVRKKSSAAKRVAQLAKKVTVLTDDFSLRERGIEVDEVVDGVKSSDIDTLVDLIAEDGRKVIWH